MFLLFFYALIIFGDKRKDRPLMFAVNISKCFIGEKFYALDLLHRCIVIFQTYFRTSLVQAKSDIEHCGEFLSNSLCYTFCQCS
jgi:hypothetical protein